MGLTVSFVLSPVIGLCCHRRLRCRKLDAGVEASGPHDFAVRLSAVRQQHYPRPSHLAPTSVTCARPSVGRDGGVLDLIWANREAEYFCKRGWTACGLICPSASRAITCAVPDGSLRRASSIWPEGVSNSCKAGNH